MVWRSSVYANDCLPSWFSVAAGVRQGNVMLPWLFSNHGNRTVYASEELGWHTQVTLSNWVIFMYVCILVMWLIYLKSPLLSTVNDPCEEFKLDTNGHETEVHDTETRAGFVQYKIYCVVFSVLPQSSVIIFFCVIQLHMGDLCKKSVLLYAYKFHEDIAPAKINVSVCSYGLPS